MIAELRQGPGGLERVLRPSTRQRSLPVGGDVLLLGFPAAPNRRPLAELTAAEVRELVDTRGERRPELSGGWTHLYLGDDSLTISTDDFNTRPLFVRADRAGVSVGDEIWPLLDPDHELDPAGLADFLFVGHHLWERTAFAGVESTRAATRWQWASGEVTRELVRPAIELHAEDAAEAEFDGAMNRLLDPYRDAERMLIQLSGGLDSRVLLALALEAGVSVHAWSFVTRTGSEEEQIARAVVRELGVPHTVSTADDVTAEAIRELIEATSGHLNLNDAHAYRWSPPPPPDWPLMVNGMMGDVFAGGSFLLPASTPENGIVRARLIRLLGGHRPEDVQMYLPGLPDWSAELEAGLDALYGLVGRRPRLADWMVLLNRCGRFNAYGSIAHRPHDYIAPFLDTDLASVCYSMPDSRQRDSVAYLQWIAERWPRLARIPWEKTGVPLDRRPGGLGRRWRYLRRRYSVGRPIAFADFGHSYRRSRSYLIPAAERAARLLGEHGIDAAALLDDHSERSWHGRHFRFRLATLDGAIALSRSGSRG